VSKRLRAAVVVESATAIVLAVLVIDDVMRIVRVSPSSRSM
jgi:hypothetical protein